MVLISTLVNGWGTDNIASATTRHESGKVWAYTVICVILLSYDMVESQYVAHFVGECPLGKLSEQRQHQVARWDEKRIRF